MQNVTSQSASTRNEWRAWELAYANLLVDTVNRIRAAREMTVRQLAAALESCGWPAGSSTLNGILIGRKRASFSVGEVLAFAQALEVPPIYLLLALPAASSLPAAPLLPEEAATNAALLEWLQGERDPEGRPLLQQSIVAVRDLQDHVRHLRAVMWENTLLLAVSRLDDEDRERLPGWSDEQAEKGLRLALRQLRSTRGADGRSAELRVQFPPLPPALSFVDDPSVDLAAVPVPIDGAETIASRIEAESVLRSLAGGGSATP